jgi:hypothetical protein
LVRAWYSGTSELGLLLFSDHRISAKFNTCNKTVLLIPCFTGATRFESGCHIADRTQAEQGGEEQNGVLTVVLRSS